MEPPHADASSLAVAERIEEARRGSLAVRGELFENCRNYLLLVANRELDAELRAKLGPSDLVQETFVRAQQHFERFEGKSDAELRAWLTQILVNRCHDARRAFCQAAKRQGERAIGESFYVDLEKQLPIDQRTPSKQIIASEEALDIAAAMSKLSDVHQQVLRLRYWEELTFEVIGRQLGRTGDAARKLWYRAIERLGEELERQYERERR
jgi:RNA polymerase sigma-70 factor (ECF subfamily)